jgi:hypothetical protein
MNIHHYQAAQMVGGYRMMKLSTEFKVIFYATLRKSNQTFDCLALPMQQ